jgi:hypothetical protein
LPLSDDDIELCEGNKETCPYSYYCQCYDEIEDELLDDEIDDEFKGGLSFDVLPFDSEINPNKEENDEDIPF